MWLIKKVCVPLQCKNLYQMSILEKLGDFTLTVVNLIIGGIIFAAIMSEKEYPIGLYIVAACLAVCLLGFAIILFYKSKKQ
ncbi:hypothetical protein AGMMS4956_18680 [Bacteroidia bacterium]|nr:hypothetical protein AGMMS4956_18680 [Bacteroidia bacterium]